MSAGVPWVRAALAVRRHSTATVAELRNYQDAQLRRLLSHAYERVPYYRSLFDRHRLHPRHIRGVADLDLIPITSKQDLRSQPETNLLASGLDLCGLATARTSGSSGEPFTVRRTVLEDKLNYFFAFRALSALGVRPRDRLARVALRRDIHSSPKRIRGMIQRFGFDRTLTLDGLSDPADLADSLGRYSPHVIIGAPSMLYRLAEHLLETGDESIRPRVLIAGGEVLTALTRGRMEQAFAAPVKETYASHEFPLLGWECPITGEFHTSGDGVLIEVLRDGRPVGPGEQGEVVATNLCAYAMPFIRYRLYDVVTRGADQCACGKPFSTIRSIRGRSIDYFSLPGGRTLHPYEILSGLVSGWDSWIRQYQLLQERTDRIVLRVQPRAEVAPDRIIQVERAVGQLLGPEVEFRVQLLDELRPEPSGKFRACLSLVPLGARQVSDGRPAREDACQTSL